MVYRDLLFKTLWLHFPQCNLATVGHHWRGERSYYMLLPLFPHMQLPLLPPHAELLPETCEHTLIRKIGGLPSRTTVEKYFLGIFPRGWSTTTNSYADKNSRTENATVKQRVSTWCQNVCPFFMYKCVSSGPRDARLNVMWRFLLGGNFPQQVRATTT